MAAIMTHILGGEEVQLEVRENKKLWKIIQDFLYKLTCHKGYSLRGDDLLYNDKLVVAKSSRFIPLFLAEFHSTLDGGQSGFFRIYKMITFVLYWEGMKNDVKRFVAK